MANRVTQLKVNGATRSVDVEAERTLLSVLRDDFGLTGSKYGCGEGKCGACTVLLDGQAAHSCTAKVGAVASRSITTVEGLEKEGRLHPLQQAFLDLGAFQCAYCTPGMIMAGVGLLASHTDPSDAQIIDAMQGNICRCGTYPRIVAAIRRAASLKKGDNR
jgi:aerobic-type carbon monoxide dehydrogenase small subunit (CoxS/CutS family)